VTVTVTDALLATDSTTFSIVVAAAPIPVAITSETIKINVDIGLSTSVGFLGGLPAPVAAVSTLIDSTKVSFTPLKKIDELTLAELDALTTPELDILAP
jgi:hypothetical protein